MAHKAPLYLHQRFAWNFMRISGVDEVGHFFLATVSKWAMLPAMSHPTFLEGAGADRRLNFRGSAVHAPFMLCGRFSFILQEGNKQIVMLCHGECRRDTT